MSNIEEKKRAVKKRPGQETVHKKKKKKELPPLTAGKKFKECIRSIIFCASLGTFAFAATGLLVIFAGYYTSQREYSDINDKVVIGTEETGKEETQPQTEPAETETDENGEIKIIETQPAGHYIPIQVDDEYYRAVNSDYAMYIYVPGTEVQYPVVAGRPDGHYLRYTFKGTENMAGAIFIDHRIPREDYLNTFNIIICGHNRKDGTMFSGLVSYMDESFRDNNPYIYLIKDGKEYVYEVFAFYELEPVSKIYNPATDPDTYMSIINEHNTYKKKTDVTTSDRIISLYTCNDDSSMRYLIHAVLREEY